VEATLKPALLDLQAKHPVIGDVRGMGAMLAIEFMDQNTGEPAADIAKAVQTCSPP
jgi:4-aminobutyrate aminotransferase / (S)-3-amino-2-methylpropionate transaminase / 5-aminovalerate transaminase